MFVPIINKLIDLKYFFIFFCSIMFYGPVTSVAISDGLDGMVSFPLIMNFIFLSIVSIFVKKYEYLIISVVSIGFLLSFLFFNINRAKIFMSDCGAVLCGMLMASLYILLKVELFMFIVGGLFAVNVFTIVLQVIAIKFYKKKIFKMAPLHHHFELLGFQETTIVFYVWLISLILLICGLYAYLTLIF
jgi:phospho-N-acetylmuramoyl-pentapeptide-transferase